MSVKIQVVFYSMYGHIYKMAEAIVEGVKQVPGAEVSLYQVAEHLPDNILEQYGAKAAKASFAKVPVAKVEQLAEADAIIFGTPTRSEIWPDRCAISSTRPAPYGCRVR